MNKFLLSDILRGEFKDNPALLGIAEKINGGNYAPVGNGAADNILSKIPMGAGQYPITQSGDYFTNPITEAPDKLPGTSSLTNSADGFVSPLGANPRPTAGNNALTSPLASESAKSSPVAALGGGTEIKKTPWYKTDWGRMALAGLGTAGVTALMGGNGAQALGHGISGMGKTAKNLDDGRQREFKNSIDLAKTAGTSKQARGEEKRLNLDNAKFKRELANDYFSQAKDYDAVINTANEINSLAANGNTRINSLAIATKFAHAIDPRTGVRDQELNNVINSYFPELAEKVRRGVENKTVSDETVEDIRRVVNILKDTGEKRLQGLKERFYNQGGEVGWDRDYIDKNLFYDSNAKQSPKVIVGKQINQKTGERRVAYNDGSFDIID
jgi:hypothetical protein